MSTLVTSNISDGTTSVGTGYVVNGSAKAYAKYDTVSAPTTLTTSLNVSSLTDHGVGDTSSSFSSAMTSRDYIVVAGADDSSWGTVVTLDYSNGNTASVSRNRTAYNNGTANVDCADVYITIHGDLA